MWIEYNPNPKHKNTGDCAVRAISKAFDVTWDKSKAFLDVYSMELSEVETSDLVWGKILHEHGFKMKAVYGIYNTLESFCRINNKGIYVVKLPNHVVTVIDGNYYDSWNSGNEVPLYCWYKRG